MYADTSLSKHNEVVLKGLRGVGDWEEAREMDG